MTLIMNKSEVAANSVMRSWNVLLEATIQGVKIRGTITCHSSRENTAKELARSTFINQLRRAGIWADTNEVDESYEVETVGPKNKKTGKPTVKVETKHKKVTKYLAPYWDHVKAIDIIEDNSYDFTFSAEELEGAALAKRAGRAKPKRRTSGDVALAARKKKQKMVAKQEVQAEKKKKALTNKQNKAALLQMVEKYFTASTAKVIKIAVKDLSQTYQRIRYALFQIKDNGYNGAKYTLIETKIDDNKAFQLKKV